LFLMVYFSATMFAADKPAWTIDYKKLNLPKHPKSVEVGKEVNHDPAYKVQITPDNIVLISFWERRSQTKLATNDSPDKSGSVFVVLLLSSVTGEVIRRIEWPVIGESLRGQKFSYGSRIYPLPSGGYVGIINRHLQIHDSSFDIVYDRVLERYIDAMYDIIVPLHGKFFIFKSWEEPNWVFEIVDSEIFKTVERLNLPTYFMEIWGDKLFIMDRPVTQEIHFYEKMIGASQWNVLGLLQGIFYPKSGYIYNGTIIVTGSIKEMPDTKGFWFKINNGKNSETVFEGIGISKPSRNAPIIANKRGVLSDFRRTFDMDSKDWIEAYDLNTRQVLLATKRYSASDIVDYAISPDGDSIVLMTKKKIELYNVNPKKDKKK